MKRKIIAAAMLLVFAPACAITAAGMASHWSNFLTGENAVETGGYMVMADVYWALPHSASYWFYEHYPAWAYMPATRHLEKQLPNSPLEYWKPWNRHATNYAPHWTSLLGIILGFLVGLIPSVILVNYKPSDKSSGESKQREQQPSAENSKVETEGARQQRITDEKKRLEKTQQKAVKFRADGGGGGKTATSEAPAKQQTARTSQQQLKPELDKKSAVSSKPNPKQPAETKQSSSKPATKEKPKPAQTAAAKKNVGDDGDDDDEDEIFDKIIK